MSFFLFPRKKFFLPPFACISSVRKIKQTEIFHMLFTINVFSFQLQLVTLWCPQNNTNYCSSFAPFYFRHHNWHAWVSFKKEKKFVKILFLLKKREILTIFLRVKRSENCVANRGFFLFRWHFIWQKIFDVKGWDLWEFNRFWGCENRWTFLLILGFF